VVCPPARQHSQTWPAAGCGGARPHCSALPALPCRLSYKGLGEPLCFTAFGPLALPAFYLALLPPALQAGAAAAAAAAVQPPVPALVWLLSVLVGITTSVILFCSHFHQIEGDTAAGKRSPLVKLGTAKACQVLKAATVAPYLVAAAGAAAGVLPTAALLATALSLPAAVALLQFAERHHTVPALIAPLKKFATKWHMAFGFALVAGLLAADMRLLVA
jgi:1,4-dihydroxy-2-naphthoate octaprenyltransferase